MHTEKCFFCARIAELNNKQNKEIKKIYESVIASKLKLGSKFPQNLLYIQWTVIGIGLLQLSTVIAILAVRQCVGNLRLNKNVGQMIAHAEEIIIVKTGMSNPLSEMNPDDRY